jgi:hypothetical protein
MLLSGFLLGILVAAIAIPTMLATVSPTASYKNPLALPWFSLFLGGLLVLGAIFPDIRFDGSHVNRLLTGLILLLCGVWNLRQARARKKWQDFRKGA